MDFIFYWIKSRAARDLGLVAANLHLFGEMREIVPRVSDAFNANVRELANGANKSL